MASNASPSGSEVKRIICTSFAYIEWADADTDLSIFQIKGHNAVMKSFKCPLPEPLNLLEPLKDE